MRLSLSNTLATSTFLSSGGTVAFYFGYGGDDYLIQNSDNWFSDPTRTTLAGSTPLEGSIAYFGTSDYAEQLIKGSLSTNFNSIFQYYCTMEASQCGTGRQKFYGESAVANEGIGSTGYINDYTKFYDASSCKTLNPNADYCEFHNFSFLYGVDSLVAVGTYAKFYDESSSLGAIVGDFSEFYGNSYMQDGNISSNAKFYDTSFCGASDAEGNIDFYDNSGFGATVATQVILHDSSYILDGYAPSIKVSYVSNTIWNYPTNSFFLFSYSGELVLTNGSGSSDITKIIFSGSSEVGFGASSLYYGQLEFQDNSIMFGGTNNASSLSFFDSAIYNASCAVKKAVFNDNSINDGTLYTYDSPSMESIRFKDNSMNNNDIFNVSGGPEFVIFEGNAVNNGYIDGDVTVYYPSPNPIGGVVTGDVIYIGYP